MTAFTDVPTLEGRHVRLEALTPDHAAGVLAAADSDEIFTWLTFARPTDLHEAQQLVAFYLDNPALRAWAQIDTRTGRVVGLTTYYDVDPAQRTVAIGYTWLGSSAWRSGINTEAKLLLLGHAFDTLGCVRVAWHADSLNDRSCAAILRIGGVREGTLRKHKQRRDGSWRDTAVFSMTDDEWPAARDRLRARLDR